VLEPERLAAIFQIIVADLLLSGDNAVVIGLAARRLSPENRRKAVVLGGAGAVGLRILFTAMAALLLDVPYLQAAGGLLLFWIAYRLLRPSDHSGNIGEAGSLGQAIRTIVLADVIMSLDNILAVAASAHGDLWLLLFGLALSIPILLFGSDLVARLLGQYPILVYVGVVVLLYAAVQMVVEDGLVKDRHHFSAVEILGLTVVSSGVVFAIAWWIGRTRGTAPEPGETATEATGLEAPGAGSRPSSMHDGDGAKTLAERRPVGVGSGPAAEPRAMNPNGKGRRRSG